MSITQEGTCSVCGEYFYDGKYENNEKHLAAIYNSFGAFSALECNVCSQMTENERMLHNRLVDVEIKLGIRKAEEKY